MSINVQSSATFTAILDGAATGLTGDIALTVLALPIVADAPPAIARSTAAIVEAAAGAYVATRTAPATVGDYLVVWDLPDDGDPPSRATVTEAVKVWPGEPPDAPPLDSAAFASADDVARRRGLTFDTDELVTATLLVQMATAAIVTAVDKDEAWAEALSPVPPMLRALCIQVASRAMGNPDSLRSVSEGLGAHQYSASFRDDGGGIELTDTEERLARRVVYGRLSGSARACSVIGDLAVEYGLDLLTLIGYPYDACSDDGDSWIC